MAIDKKKDRSETIGCSDIAVIMGISPYKTPVQLWREKCRIVIPKNIDDKEHIEWGNRLEPIILDKYEENNGVLILRDECFTHPKYPWFQGNLDGRDPARNIIVEAKTVTPNGAYKWGEPGSCQIPPEYVCQALGYMYLTDSELTHFPVLIAGSRYREYAVCRDDNKIKQIEEAVVTFRECVETKKPPKPKNYEDIMRLWTPDEKRVLHVKKSDKLHADTVKHIKALVELQAAKEELTNRWKLERQSVADYLVQNQAAAVFEDGRKLAWVQKGAHGHSLRLATDEPEED